MPYFVPPRLAGDAEVVGVGDDLTTESLLDAYSQGIFPWPIPGYPLLWFCPPQRAVLDFDRLHVPARLARLRRNTALTFTIDRAFDAVIAACRRTPRPNQGSDVNAASLFLWLHAPFLPHRTLYRTLLCIFPVMSATKKREPS